MAKEGKLRVNSNFQTLEKQKKEKHVIYIDVNNSSSTIVAQLTIDEAEQVAVALFNQILYHRSIQQEN